MKPFQYMKLAVTFRGLDKKVYPYFLGSFIRGNVGMYLKKAVCPFHFRKSCDQCLIRKKCFYTRIFEAQGDGGSRDRDIPLPFVIDLVDSDSSRAFEIDLQFSILLFGPALENYEFFILVFSQMGRQGIGKRRIQCRDVSIADQDGRLIYSSEQEKILHSPSLSGFQFNGGGVVPRLQVSYRSPVRLKRDGQLVRSPDFETLIRSSLRRFVYLKDLYGTLEELPTAEIVEGSVGVRTVVSDIYWVDRYRYSNRTRLRMNLGGLLGRQEFAGDIMPFHVDLLRFASIFHLGNSSSFGHGKIEVDVRTQEASH